jgi:hypothetical protein
MLDFQLIFYGNFTQTVIPAKQTVLQFVIPAKSRLRRAVRNDALCEL